jgi:zinc transporter
MKGGEIVAPRAFDFRNKLLLSGAPFAPSGSVCALDLPACGIMNLLSQSGVTDSEGLICGFALDPSAVTPLIWNAQSRVLPGEMPARWLHFNLADIRACHWIEACEAIPADARELLLDSDSHIRCELFDQGIALVLGDLHHDFNGDPEGLGVLYVYVDNHLLVTGRRHPLRAVDQLRLELQRGAVVPSTPQLFARLIHDVDMSFHQLIKTISDDLDEAEDEILAGRIHDHGSELGRLRRLLARLRRHMGAGRQTLQQSVSNMARWCSLDDIDELREAIQHLEGTAQDLELVQERTRLLQEEIGSRLSEATNRNLYILSVVTVALLPINLITGIFGMNTGGLPWSDSPHGFWWVVFWMVIAVAAALRFLHSRKIL